MTGASGCVGRAVVRALLAAGHDVVAAQRTRPSIFPAAVGWRAFDAGTPAVAASLFEGVDALVHLAATAHVVPRSSSEVDRMVEVNGSGSRRVADAAARAGVRRMVYASSVAVYGSGRTTGDAPCPDTPYGRSKLLGERPFLDAGGVILRLSLIFGDGDRGNLAVLAKQVRAWGGVVLGDGSNRKSMAYAPHVGERIERILATPSIPEAAFDLVDYSPTQRELLDSIARAVGRPPPHRVPLRPFQAAGTLIDAATRALGRSPRWRRRVDKLVEETTFSGAALDRLLSYEVPRTLDRALHETFGGAA